MVLPGSLDYLYYNGILDHIPYEAYEMTPAYNSGIYSNFQQNANQYLNTAKSGAMYNTYTSKDTFIPRDFGETKTGEKYSFEKTAYGNDLDNFREGIRNSAYKAKESVTNTPSFIKGLIAGGIIIGTVCSLFKGKKQPVQQPTNHKFWTKLNPLNWFKK